MKMGSDALATLSVTGRGWKYEWDNWFFAALRRGFVIELNELHELILRVAQNGGCHRIALIGSSLCSA
jgi:hypothetical protein